MEDFPELGLEDEDDDEIGSIDEIAADTRYFLDRFLDRNSDASWDFSRPRESVSVQEDTFSYTTTSQSWKPVEGDVSLPVSVDATPRAEGTTYSIPPVEGISGLPVLHDEGVSADSSVRSAVEGSAGHSVRSAGGVSVPHAEGTCRVSIAGSKCIEVFESLRPDEDDLGTNERTQGDSSQFATPRVPGETNVSRPSTPLDEDDGYNEDECEQRAQLQSSGSSREIIRLETKQFLEEMKKKSGTRLKILDENDKLKTAESEKIRKGLEKIEKLDLKLREIERRGSASMISNDTETSLAARRIREERKERKRLMKLKRSLEHLDAMNDKQDHCIRNIMMGPNAKYFRLTPEENALVEEILQQRDLVDDDMDSGSISSYVTTAFDVEGEEAVRLAEIESRLDPYRESHSHSYCSSTPVAMSGSTPKFEPRSLSKVPDSMSSFFSMGLSRQHEAVSRALEPFVTTTAVEDYLAELKDRREFEEKLEAIDKQLRLLQTAEMPTSITPEELIQLVNDSRKEQEFDMLSSE